MSSPDRLTIDLPHLRFEALAWGPQDGRLMLCLHGYPDTAWTWRHLGPYFAERAFRVVAPFMRGYAPTELARDGDYGVGALMYDAIALHEKLGAGPDAVLVGHDWGGLAANGIAAYPENPFGKVVSMGVPLVAGLLPGSGNGRRLLRLLPRQLRMSWYIAFQQLPGVSERYLYWVLPKLWRDWCPPGYHARTDLEHVWHSLPDRKRRTAALSYYRAAFRPFRRGRHHRALDRYAMGQHPVVPMLVVHGRIDGAIDARIGALGSRALPAGSSAEIIDNAGHFMHLDQPAIVHRLISDYVTA
ncbi:alpha/beta hydrolase [Mycobacterium intracellulare]|uniref:alpha/beta fold hydrolase n=1 Tax=Mycobacterium intracellulare TaxID=1767 RepID=UPI0007E945AC|nr:alpha/beta hydrolase [Mycobacterium intracellulare]OBH72416.1 alpha/beta hydrolase [Mycobacterium intracellulare]